ncbi:MAG: hypothetical protein U0793_23430 [Gemmataceae bacterium]
MHGAGWIDVIRRFPPALHDVISFATVSGSEIMAQDILRLDEDFIVLRGRMGGTQDAGRIIVLPYAHIVDLMVSKQLKDEEVQAIFGGEPLVFATPARKDAPQEKEEGEGNAEQAPAAPPNLATIALQPQSAAASTDNSAPKPAQVSKTILLARLRQRLAEQGKRSE